MLWAVDYLAQFALTRGGYGQIISQYVETESGTSPKGIEIWNNTEDTLRFASYPLSVWKGTNGADPRLDFILECIGLELGAHEGFGYRDLGYGS